MNVLLLFRLRIVAALVLACVALALGACEQAGPTAIPLGATGTPALATGPLAPTTAATGSGVAATATPASPPTPTAAPCTVITTTEALRLSDVPDAVRGPLSLAQAGGDLYVAGRVSNNLGVVQGDALRQVLPTGPAPSQLAADSATGKLYILNQFDRTISLYEGGRIRSTIALSSTLLASYQQLESMALDTAHNRLYAVVSASSSDVFAIDTTAFTVTGHIFLPEWHTAVRLALAPGGDRLYVGGYDRVDVVDIASGTIAQTIPLPGPSYRILTVDGATGRIFFDLYDQIPFVGVIEDGKVIGRVPVGMDAVDAVVSDNRLFVANAYSHTVSVVDIQGLTLAATVDVGPGPRALLADNRTGRVYVGLEGTYGREVNRLDVIDTATLSITRGIPLSPQPSQLIGHTARGRLYALMPSQNAVVISDGQRVLQTVPLERAPMQMALDERTDRLYVTDSLTGRVTVIDGMSGNVIERRAVAMPTRPNAVAVDDLNRRLVVNNRTFALDTLEPSGYFTLTGYAIPYGEGETPQRVIANAQVPRLYVVASNGVPGSNNGLISYLVDSAALKPVSLSYDRNVSAMVFDGAAQKLFTTATHPIGGYTLLTVLDGTNFTRIHALPMPLHVTALALNPQTQHLFATMRSLRYGSQASTPEDFRLDVLDARTLGRAASMRIGPDPTAAAVLGDRIYIAHAGGNTLTVVRDCPMAAVAAPTATPSPTPYPTAPPPPSPTPTPTRTRTPTPSPVLPSPTPAVPCQTSLVVWLQTPNYATFDFRANVGCPAEAPRAAQLAKQFFQNGTMYWRADTRKIYVILNNGGWRVFDDTWDSTQPEGSTEKPPSLELHAPKRGFGKVWREVLGGPNAEIGWALTEELGVTGEVQAFERGLALRDDAGATYVLAPSGSWR